MVVAVLEEVLVGAALVVLRSQVGVHFEHCWSKFNANEQHNWHELDWILVEAFTCCDEGVVLGT